MKEYKDLKEVEKDIKKGVLFDIIKIGGIVFTQDFYDLSGKEITFGNKKKNKGFIIETNDRYKEGFNDAILSWVDNPLFRDDIHYY